MTHIIELKKALSKRKKQQNQDITTLLKKAVLLRKKMVENDRPIHITSFENLKKNFEARIADILIKWKIIDAGAFLCGNYVSGLLTSVAYQIPESWFVIDYIIQSQESNSPQIVKKGANICFLICTIFKERSELRAMRYEDYERMGIGLFRQFYSQTGVEIGYHMSREYRTMVQVTDECIHSM